MTGSEAIVPVASGPVAGEPEPRIHVRVGNAFFGLPLAAIREVALLGPLTRLPGRAPGALLGVMNLRGRVVLVADLGLVLGGEPAHRGAASERVLVVDEGRRDVALLVSEVLEIAHLAAEAEQDGLPPRSVEPLATGELLQRIAGFVEARVNDFA